MHNRNFLFICFASFFLADKVEGAEASINIAERLSKETVNSISKLELRLNLKSIKDPTIRNAISEALPSIKLTLLTLTDDRYDLPLIKEKLGWSGSEPLRLPPENLHPHGPRPGTVRWSFAFSRADDWAMVNSHTITFVATFVDMTNRISAREEQHYERSTNGWRLSKQVRL